MNRLLSFIYVIYCLEVGIFLLIFPWMRLWDDNSLLSYLPALRELVSNNFVRGAVSGLGVVNLVLFCLEVSHFLRSSRPQATSDSLRDF